MAMEDGRWSIKVFDYGCKYFCRVHVVVIGSRLLAETPSTLRSTLLGYSSDSLEKDDPLRCLLIFVQQIKLPTSELDESPILRGVEFYLKHPDPIFLR